MANGLQRFVYHLANAVPLLFMTALVWHIQYKTWSTPVGVLAVAVIITILFSVCFSYGKKNCSIKNINVSSISSKDSWLVAYVIAYLAPFADMIMSNFRIVSLIVVVLMLGIVIVPSIMALPNILLFFVGYHFYEIGTDSTGVSDYLLISKRRRIRHKTDVKRVMRVFEKLLIDTKGNR